MHRQKEFVVNMGGQRLDDHLLRLLIHNNFFAIEIGSSQQSVIANKILVFKKGYKENIL